MRVMTAVGCVLLSWSVAHGAQVLVKWEDTKNTMQTGYAVERKVDAGEYTPLTDTLGPEARSFVDETPLNGKNCYVVYARGPAGPSGFSTESCLDVTGTTPIPPIPPSEAGQVSVKLSLDLTCTGTYQSGTTPLNVVLNCTSP